MAENHDLRALRAAGKTYREIKAITGLSLSQINYRLSAVPPAPTIKPRRRKGHQERKCMTCGTTFMSEGPHNRMCNACRQKSASPFDIPAVIRYR
jgi:hypothetical protein